MFSRESRRVNRTLPAGISIRCHFLRWGRHWEIFAAARSRRQHQIVFRL